MEVNEQRDDAPASISVWFLRRWLAHRDTSFEIPSLAWSEVQDSVGYITHDRPAPIKQLNFDNQIRKPVVARICYRTCSVA